MIPALFLISATILFRVATGLAIISGSTWIANFAPLAAIALCAAAYFPPRFTFTVPMIALLISDVVLNLHYGFPLLSPFVLSHYVAFALIGCLGLSLRNRAGFKTLLPASLAASLIFYCVTNTVSWIFDAGYPKTFAGFMQAQTIGLPVFEGTTPTWMFFRNTALSDLFFTALFVACMKFSNRHTATIATRQAVPHAA